MAIQIDGVQIKKMSIVRDEKGVPILTGEYELKTNTGITVAVQSFNDYGGVKINFSEETMKNLNSLVAGITMNVNSALGLA